MLSFRALSFRVLSFRVLSFLLIVSIVTEAAINGVEEFSEGEQTRLLISSSFSSGNRQKIEPVANSTNYRPRQG